MMCIVMTRYDDVMISCAALAGGRRGGTVHLPIYIATTAILKPYLVVSSASCTVMICADLINAVMMI